MDNNHMDEITQTAEDLPLPNTSVLLGDVCKLIEQARERTAIAVNPELTLLYWNIGNRIRKDILCDQRAEYGRQIVGTLSRQLTEEYGRGFTRDNLLDFLGLHDGYSEADLESAIIRRHPAALENQPEADENEQIT
jgi:hypothetical protein